MLSLRPRCAPELVRLHEQALTLSLCCMSKVQSTAGPFPD